jgi:hypothetical protein
MMEGKISAAMLLRCFRFSLRPGDVVEKEPW